MMFVALLLAAGMLALEREENAFGRLVRGLVSRSGLVTEKVGLAALAAFVLTTVMLGILGALHRARLRPRRRCGWWRSRSAPPRSARWAWRSAGSRARSARPRWPRSWSRCRWRRWRWCLAAPSARALYDVSGSISGVFPFRPCLDALDAAISGGALLAPLLHLVALTRAFGVIARLSLRRFA